MRVPNLTFAHHQAVAYEEEKRRTKLLAWASANKATVGQLTTEKHRRILADKKTSITGSIDGKYDVIVIDPPWVLQKIQRRVRPRQTTLEYPTMTLYNWQKGHPSFLHPTTRAGARA